MIPQIRRGLAFAIAAVVLNCAGFWIHGFNFDHRGNEAAAAFVSSLLVGMVGAFIVIITTYEKP